MKIASWNVNSLRVRLPQLLQWLASEQPDVIGLQELKMQDEDFPVKELQEAGYHAVFNGQKTYNGVALLSRVAGDAAVRDLPGYDDPQKRVIAATYGDVRVINLYVPNGQAVGSDKYEYKLRWLKQLHEFLRLELQMHPKCVVAGDFNIAPEDRDVYDPDAWRDQVLCSAPEREALQSLFALGFKDSFRLFDQPAQSFSWWDYRAAGFRRNLGLRIDHILVSDVLAPACRSSRIDKVPRAWERPSDHAPVVAEFD
ncbi:MAG: exodeoxyribonuclease III [Pseudomonadota bacterium]